MNLHECRCIHHDCTILVKAKEEMCDCCADKDCGHFPPPDDSDCEGDCGYHVHGSGE